jgi:drug/metabolite transporter (DMT)-like permease
MSFTALGEPGARSLADDKQHRALTPGAASFALALTGIWSGLGIAIKYGLEDAPPFRLGWYRFVAGALTVLVWALWVKADLRVRRHELPVLAAVGAMFCFELGFMNVGLSKTSASHGSVIISSFPIWVAVFAHFQIPGDRLDRRKVAGTLVAYAGIVVIFVQGMSFGADLIVGDLLMLASALVLAEHQVFSARAAGKVEIAKLILARFAMGTAVFVAVGLAVEDEPWVWTARLGWSVFYQGVVIAGFGFIGNLWLLKRYFPSQVAVISLIGPVASILLAWALLDEEPTGLLWAGAALIVAGALLVQKRSGQAAN